MLVLVNGLPYFGRVLVRDLNEFDSKNKYIFLDTYYSKLDKLFFFFLVPFSKLIISFNGVSDNSGALNWVLKWNKKILMQWQGSDVMIAKQRSKENKIDLRYINKAVHVTDFEYLFNELSEINIHAKILPFKHLESEINNKRYTKIAVLTYVSQNNENLYGFDTILEVAKELADIEFHIIGSNCENYLPLPDNMYVHGWKSKHEVKELMNNIPIFIRMTKHDGNALTVSEALSRGCEVIWTYPSNLTYQANSKADLVNQILFLKKRIEERGLTANQYNSAKILEHYNKEVVINNYVKFINSIL